MPPSGFRKRLRSVSPAPLPSAKKKTTPNSKRAKPTLFETVDAPTSRQQTLRDNQKFLEEQDDQSSSLSDAESDDFEDVPAAKRRKIASEEEAERQEEHDEDGMDWEDAIAPGASSEATPVASRAEEEIGDISISMNEDGSYVQPLVSAATGKKGPSKLERQVRVQSHCLHVQALMWHNTIRNSWLNDKEVLKILVDDLPEGVKREVQRWKEAMGMLSEEEMAARKKQVSAKSKSKRGKAGKGKGGGRDWHETAQWRESGLPNMSAGDPLLRLLKVLTAYWRKRFLVTAPGLRKQGYMPLRRLRDEIGSWQKDRKDSEQHGERIENKKDFRKLAKTCEGSRDVGAQLFVALLRGLGLEARLVANLQPVGFGWSKAEDADLKKPRKTADAKKKVESDSESEGDIFISKAQSAKRPASGEKETKSFKKGKPVRKSSRGHKGDPINLEDSRSGLSSVPSDFEEFEGKAEDDDDDDLSVIDVTPSTPRRKPTKKYDRDLSFPNYWTEVCSPATHKCYPVDPIVLSTIASSDELLQSFEPRGKRAEKAKQVMCYTIAHSADGTAKDVTVRYLKRHQLPGKTKGMRIQIEKVPVYNRKGKVKKYEEYDWFRTVISLYDRPESKRTSADDLEEQTDLKPFKPAKEQKEVAKESLQGYKQSADFVLEQHLRREEAILPGAELVKSFAHGKGDDIKEVPVYRREDVVVCKTVESWHKEGRAIKVGEQPMKYVPMRAVTLIRKREIEDAQRETGEKLKQGLYSHAQTDWIIPPPIANGVIPKNAFGNMDVYVPTMVPKGAVHLPLKGSAKLCRRLDIDYAEACTGFEFGKQRAVPVLTGVVVAKENAAMVKDAWRVEQEEVKRKEDTKRTQASLHWWRKMLLGLRVLDRMRTEYADSGAGGEEVNPFVLKARREGRVEVNHEVEMGDAGHGGGGFLRPGEEEEDDASAPDGALETRAADKSHRDLEGGGFLVEEGQDEDSHGTASLVNGIGSKSKPAQSHAPITPVSLQSMHNNTTNNVPNSGDDNDAVVPEDTKTKAPAQRLQAAKSNSRHHPAASSKSKKSARIKGKNKITTPKKETSSSSDLSDVDSSASEEEDSAASLEDKVRRPSHADTYKSPKVAISPETTSGKIRAGANRVAKKKVTPVKSQYFKHSDDHDDKKEESEESEAEESEVEVVKPRGPTSRTRGRA